MIIHIEPKLTMKGVPKKFFLNIKMSCSSTLFLKNKLVYNKKITGQAIFRKKHRALKSVRFFFIFLSRVSEPEPGAGSQL